VDVTILQVEEQESARKAAVAKQNRLANLFSSAGDQQSNSCGDGPPAEAGGCQQGTLSSSSAFCFNFDGPVGGSLANGTEAGGNADKSRQAAGSSEPSSVSGGFKFNFM